MVHHQVAPGELIKGPRLPGSTGAMGSTDRCLALGPMNKPFEDTASEQCKLLFDFENVAMQGLPPLYHVLL